MRAAARAPVRAGTALRCPAATHASLPRSHPPLGKLVFYYVSVLAGYDHTVCKYDNISVRGRGGGRRTGTWRHHLRPRTANERIIKSPCGACRTPPHPAQVDYAPECKYVVLRATAAAFGAMTGPLLYWVVRNWGGSIRAGLFAVRS